MLAVVPLHMTASAGKYWFFKLKLYFKNSWILFFLTTSLPIPVSSPPWPPSLVTVEWVILKTTALLGPSSVVTAWPSCPSLGTCRPAALTCCSLPRASLTFLTPQVRKKKKTISFAFYQWSLGQYSSPQFYSLLCSTTTDQQTSAAQTHTPTLCYFLIIIPRQQQIIKKK